MADAKATSKHVVPDPEARHDPAADLLDGSVDGVERGNVLAAEDLVGQRRFVLAALELGVAAAVVGKSRHAQAPVCSQVQLALPTSMPAAVMRVAPLQWQVESIASEAHAYRFDGTLDQLSGRRARNPACGPRLSLR